MVHDNWIPEYVAAFEHYNDLLREAQRERLARLAAPPRSQTESALENALKRAMCSWVPVRQTRLCTVNSVA